MVDSGNLEEFEERVMDVMCAVGRLRSILGEDARLDRVDVRPNDDCGARVEFSVDGAPDGRLPLLLRVYGPRLVVIDSTRVPAMVGFLLDDIAVRVFDAGGKGRRMRLTGRRAPRPPDRRVMRDEGGVSRPGWAPRAYVRDPSLPSAFVFDVDGTLAHIDPVDPRDVYDASRAMEDVADPAVARMARDLSSLGHRVVVVTGRTAAHVPVTEDWLRANGVPHDAVFSRADGDTRHDSVVKEEILFDQVAPRWNVLGVFDDRDSVVGMWRATGLTCYQVAPGDF